MERDGLGCAGFRSICSAAALAVDRKHVFQVKICGITSREDLRAAIDAGADAVGLNFYPRSKRYLPIAAAEELAVAVPTGVAKVGVFVNSPAAEVANFARRLGLDFVQLHGDEAPAVAAELAEFAVIRAVRARGDGLAECREYVEGCRALGCELAAVLIDGFSAGEYGGTGQRAAWGDLVGWRERLDVPLILAGGLTATNVAAAIELVRPSGVDTASGVESSPGRKDPEKARAFVRAARGALGAAGGTVMGGDE